MNRHVTAVILSVALTASSYGAGYFLGWITSVNWLEAFSVATSYWCTVLCVWQVRANYLVGAVSVASLGLLFWQQSLYASMALQVWLFPAMLYGWLRWGPDTDTRPVTRLKLDWYLLGYAAVTCGVFAACWFINDYFAGAMAWVDTAVLVLSILAQFLLDNKKIENWIVWIAVDVLSVYDYTEAGLSVVAVQMGLFILNAVWGLVEWNATRKSEGVAA